MRILNVKSCVKDYSFKNPTSKEEVEEFNAINNISQVSEVNSKRDLYEVKVQPAFKTIYNNATLSNKEDNSEIEKTEEEINDEVNRKLYERSTLPKMGIKFNSKEFKEWLLKLKHNFPIPPDAPAKVRKEVYDMLDSIDDPGIKFLIVRDFARGFRKAKEPLDLNECMKVTKRVLQKNKDEIELLRILNSPDPRITNSIKISQEVVSFLSNFKSKLNSLIEAEEEKNLEFPELKDQVAQAIRKNVKDPIDREEDLSFWKSFCASFTFNKTPTYKDFLKLKEDVICFPPLTAPGRVKRQYREYMNKLPKDIRDKVQGEFAFTYSELLRSHVIDKKSTWRQIINAMNKNLGIVRDLTLDFSIVQNCMIDIKNMGNNHEEFNKLKEIVI